MPSQPNLSGHRVLIPGGTGTVGAGVVRQYLAAGADVVVPTRTPERAAQFRRVLGPDAPSHLHLVVHDYTTFAGAEDLAAQTERRLGGIDDVVAPIGGFWGGRRLWEVDEADWQGAFVELATTHLAVLRACLPRLNPDGAYLVVVGGSAFTPVPGSGLVSMEQAAVAMMQQVAAAELGGRPRVFGLVLGPVRTRDAGDPGPGQVTADQIGAVAVAASAATSVDGQQLQLHSQDEAAQALARLAAAA
jgi:NAD(P)-dependent dehydrogenase (short-subunit alcohol dehydrogenase family)